MNKNQGHRVVLLSQILRLCLLAPVIRRKAAHGVNRDTVLEWYMQFYLNKYQNLDDYLFMSPDIV
jgi:hypothetical protein